jgi:hypothetical protein
VVAVTPLRSRLRSAGLAFKLRAWRAEIVWVRVMVGKIAVVTWKLVIAGRIENCHQDGEDEDCLIQRLTNCWCYGNCSYGR